MKRTYKLLLLGFGLLAIGACSTVMFDSTPIEQSQSCPNRNGGYALPTEDLIFTIANGDVDVTTRARAADGSKIYCLDFLNARRARDFVSWKIKGSLLQRVYTKSIDQTAEITQAAANAAAENEARNNANLDVLKTLSVDVSLADDADPAPNTDPFDRTSVEFTNGILAQRGFCAFIRPQGRGIVPDWTPLTCPTPGTTVSYERHLSNVAAKGIGTTATRQEPSFPAQTSVPRGIYYRPNIAHDLIILKSDDPGYAPWQIHRIETVNLPNRAPVFAVPVERGWFTDRETDLIFDDGVLVDVAVERESELNAALDIPVVIVNAILSIPVRTFRIRANDASHRQDVIQANAELLQEMEKLNAAATSLDELERSVKEKEEDEDEEQKFTKQVNAHCSSPDGNTAKTEGCTETVTNACAAETAAEKLVCFEERQAAIKTVCEQANPESPKACIVGLSTQCFAKADADQRNACAREGQAEYIR